MVSHLYRILPCDFTSHGLRHAPALGRRRGCGLRCKTEDQQGSAQGNTQDQKRDPQTPGKPASWGIPGPCRYVDTCNPVEHLFVRRTDVDTKGASDL